MAVPFSRTLEAGVETASVEGDGLWTFEAEDRTGDAGADEVDAREGVSEMDCIDDSLLPQTGFLGRLG